MSEEINKRIGDYQILDELGHGGMGRVYRVRNVISDRIEAMKVLLPDLAGRQELAARFLREIKLMASFDHPNIAGLRTAFTADNQLIMIMEYVEGITLAQLLEKGPIPPADAVNYINQVLDALSYAHERQVIHRDIKPANIMLTPQGVIKLMDFGIARAGAEHTLTMTGTTLGSLPYMSPEQVKGEATDARSDLYSVGVSLYEMVTGQRPFRADSDYSIMAAHVKEIPKPPMELQPGLPTALSDIIVMAIAKEPAKRFQTAAAFRNALSTVKIALPTADAKSASAAPTQVSTAVTAESFQGAPAIAPSRPVPTPVPPPPPESKPAAVAAVAETPSIPIPPPQPASHRGLYMTLGALIVLAGLVAAGVYIPRRSKTLAQNSEPAPASVPSTPGESTAQSTPAQSPDAQSANEAQMPAPQAPASAPSSSEMNQAAVPQQATPTPAPVAPEAASPGSAPSSAAPSRPLAAHPRRPTSKSAAGQMGDSSAQGASAASASQAANDKANELDQLESQVDQLSSRAAAADSGLDRLQQQQAAAGYGLRGDIAARQASMKNNLAKAQAALEHGDVERAKRFQALAEADVEAIEHFLGR